MARPQQNDRPRGDRVDGIYEQWAVEFPDVRTHGAQVLARARRLTLLVRPLIEAAFKRFDLDTGEFDVIATLRRHGPPFTMRPTELFKSLMISSGGLTDRLDRLEARGFVRRRASAEDARSMLVELTPAGRKCIEGAFRADMDIENGLIEALSREERGQLANLLRKLMIGLEPGP